MPRKSVSRTESPQKHRLSLAQLASYDDVITDALVDQAYFWSRIRKNRENKYLPVRGIREDEVPQILLHKVIIAKDVEDAETALLNLAGLRRYMGGLRTELEKKDFRSHLRKYINMYLPDSPFEVSTTNRYTITAQEAAVTARKRIREGDKIKYLCGTLVPLTDAELEDLDLTQRNFSIVQSDRKKNTLIFLGPARFANHDCAANGRLVSVGKDGLEVHATRNIDIGEEITVTYSPGYFGTNNEECLCHTCEIEARNGWTSADAFGAPQSSESTPIPGEALSELPYSYRNKRKHDASTEPTSRVQSPSPAKKQKLDRPPSRLNQVLTPPPSFWSIGDEAAPVTAGADRRSLQINGSTEDGISTSESLVNSGGAECAARADPPRKKRMRLIDQMTSSAGSSPEMPIKSRPSSFTYDESGIDSSSSRDSSHSTQATSISGPQVTVKVESKETSKIERDDASHSVRGTSVTHSGQQLGSVQTPFATTISKTMHATVTTKPSSIIPSIETPTSPNILTTSATETTTTTLTVLPDPTSTPTIRTPNDYILTRLLIAQPYDRWVQCQTCTEHFLQPNAYQTRRECPRCERHSKLYGFGWPKTEPDARRLREIRELKEKEEKLKAKMKSKTKTGKGKLGKKSASSEVGDTIVVSQDDERAKNGSLHRGRGESSDAKNPGGGGVWGRAGKGGGRSGRSGKGTWVEGGGEEEREERVMDHRTVNRFIAPEDERDAKKRGKVHPLEIAARITNGAGAGGKETGTATATPDGGFTRLGSGRNSVSASAREESVGSSAFGTGFGVDGEGEGTAVLRRSKRYFGSRLTM